MLRNENCQGLHTEPLQNGDQKSIIESIVDQLSHIETMIVC